MNLLGDVSFLDRVLHIEGAINVSQQFFNPFGAQPQDLANATDNRYQSTTYRVSPYVQGVAANGIAYELRNNNVWTNLSGAPIATNNSRYTEWLARVSTPEDRQIWPGSELRLYGRQVSRTKRLDRCGLRSGGVIPFYNVDPQLRLGASVGYEDNQGALTSSRGSVYGVGVEWRPTERTKVVGKWEHRYFGSSYLFTFDHRTPLSVWNVQASRNVTTYPQSHWDAWRREASVASYLNQLFLSSIPDAAARQQTVDQFIRDRGLPADGGKSGHPLCRPDHPAAVAVSNRRPCWCA